MKINLGGISSTGLRQLAEKATKLADDLSKEEPSYALAIEGGVRNKSYRTVRFGTVASYDGTAEITMADGKRWRAIGHEPTGGADWIGREGYIEFILLDAPPEEVSVE